jgi:hypothetical protein
VSGKAAAATKDRWVVRCIEYETQPVSSEATARRLLEHLEDFGLVQLPAQGGQAVRLEV